jgi:hypothetical protein
MQLLTATKLSKNSCLAIRPREADRINQQFREQISLIGFALALLTRSRYTPHRNAATRTQQGFSVGSFTL